MSSGVVTVPTLLTWPTILVVTLATDRLPLRDSLILPAISHLSEEEGWTVLQATTPAELQTHISNAQNRPVVMILVAHGKREQDGGLFAMASDEKPVLTREELIGWLTKRRFSGGVGVLCCLCDAGASAATASGAPAVLTAALPTGAGKVAWTTVDNLDSLSMEQFNAAANAFVEGLAKDPKAAAAAKAETAEKEEPQQRKSQCDRFGCSIQ